MKPPPRGLIVRRVHLGVFDFTVNVLIGPHAVAVEYAKKELRWPSLNPPSDDDLGQFWSCGGRTPVIWLPKRATTAREHATVAHEAFHAAAYVMRWAGIQLSAKSEEVFAHTLAYLVTQIGQM